MTPAQVRRFLAVAETVKPQRFPVFLFLARTGARIGETLGLRWERVDLDARLAYLSEQPWPRGRVTGVKHGHAHYVDLSAQLTMVLRQQRARVGGDWCFPGPTGWPWHRATITQAMKQVLHAGGLPGHLSPHCFRHGYASTLLVRGEPLEFVRRQLGHTDPKLTATLYGAHLLFRRLSAVDGLDE